MAALTFEHLTKTFGSNRKVLDDVHFEIEAGQMFALLGPSGCGKTTLLRLAGGFETPDTGRILLDGDDITSLPPERRPINTVFQSYALFPHLSARDNIAFGPKMAGRSRADIQHAVDAMLHLTRLEEHASKTPAQLSGGQRQRVAIARALINRPRVLLLDEPLAALDLKLRQHMLNELRTLHREIGGTFVFVTHDQTEAMSLSQKLAVMNEGRVEQIGTPREIYSSPANTFVASFIGTTNFISGTVHWCQGSTDKANPDEPLLCRINIPHLGEITATTLAEHPQGTPVNVSIRPEDIRLHSESPNPTSGLNHLRGQIEEILYLGAHSQATLALQGTRLTVHHPHSRDSATQTLARHSEIWATFHPHHAQVIPVV
ncbi:MAG: ABC transporter ATP-binding protein [Verrucomicrobiaceae bacterium]|nr:ABC transporter ATP-binding protein [Verrucomicrobiaceae bacterium]